MPARLSSRNSQPHSRVGAAPDAVEARAGQKVAGRPQHRRQQRQRRSRLHIDLPAIGAAFAPERGARGRRRQRLIEGGKIACGRCLVLGLGVEQAVQGLAQFDRPLELATRRRLAEARPAIGGRPPREILRRPERLGGLGLAAPEARVDELQAEIGAIYHQDLITG